MARRCPAFLHRLSNITPLGSGHASLQLECTVKLQTCMGVCSARTYGLVTLIGPKEQPGTRERTGVPGPSIFCSKRCPVLLLSLDTSVVLSMSQGPPAGMPSYLVNMALSFPGNYLVFLVPVLLGKLQYPPGLDSLRTCWPHCWVTQALQIIVGVIQITGCDSWNSGPSLQKVC